MSASTALAPLSAPQVEVVPQIPLATEDPYPEVPKLEDTDADVEENIGPIFKEVAKV